MAFGRNQRLDSKRSSSCCSTVTIVVFVALCLVGVWMLTSSTVVPVEMTLSTKPEVKEHVLKADSKPDGDGSQDVPEDAAWGSTIDNAEKTSKAETSADQNLSERSTENSVDSSQRNKNASVTSKSQTYNDESGTGEGSEVANSAEDTSTEDGAHNSEDQNDRKITNVEQTTVEAAEEQEEIKEQNLDQETNNGRSNSLEETSEFGGKELQQTDVDTNSIEHHEKRSDNETNSDEAIVDEQQPVKSENNSKKTKRDDQQKSNESRSLGKEGISDGESVQEGSDREQIEENVEQDGTEKNSDASNIDSQTRNQDLNDPDGTQSDLLHEKNMTNGVWTTQAAESRKEKEVLSSSFPEGQYSWKICNVTSGADYIPCLDNEVALKMLPSTKHYQHRERHCPEENPTCLVPLPNGYQRSIEWPASREKIWYHNVPHTQLAVVKGHQNWVKVSGEYLIFPGGGTQFKNGALHYIDFIEESMPDIAWGKRSRVVLDVGCGVASFGGFLFDRDVLTMSFAPKDEHEAQVQFALERGIPAISAVMGTKRLPFPSTVFDVIHCARCRVPWHIEGGMLLLELNRLLRPGGYFVWSATPVYQKLQEDQDIWSAMSALTKNMCWEMVAKRKDRLNRAGMAIYRKPSDNACYERRKQNLPPLCQDSDDPNAAWNISLQACMHKLSVGLSIRGSQWPEKWPQRLEKTPYWLNSSQMGVYGKPAPEDFQADYRHWKHIVSNSYMSGMGINWTTVRNVMDMRSVYGGFAAALQDTKVWVINVVSVDSPDTLPIIYERGLFGIYHDWCESFSTYPRTYDLLHADHLFSRIKKRCKLVPVFVEVDRILRPQGNLIVRDTKGVIDELEGIARSLKWEIKFTHSKDGEGLLCVQKTMWRPKEVDGSASSSSSP